MNISRQLLYRPIWIAVFVIGATLIVAVAVLMVTSWRSVLRVKPIHAHINEINEVQQISLHLQELLVSPTTRAAQRRRLAHVRAAIARLASADAHLSERTRADLRQVQRRLVGISADLRGRLPQVLGTLRRVVTAENTAQNGLLQELDQDTHAELALSAAIICTLPLVGLLLAFFTRRRIFQPLDSLSRLMTLLAEQDFHTVPTETIDPLLQPLFHSYNHLVGRLTTLEREHLLLQRSLERQVRDATQSLLAQQMTLSRAERLAAMGEVAAGLAHELRNPLSGVLMALGNLREELPADAEQAQRLELMIAELKRVMQLLSGLLGQARVAPEPAAEIPLGRAVEDLLILMRYQVPETIQLGSEIAPELRCRLPRDGLHQALLNLLINAAQALGDGPGKIQVDAAQREGRLRITVEDSGPGFPQDLLQLGARPFVTWRDGGTGMGLAMVRRFAQDLGGELRLANLDGGGARVTIELPDEEDNA